MDMPIRDAARELDVTEAMAYRMVRDGKLEKVAEGSVGPEGEGMRVSIESVVKVKRRIIAKLERKLAKLKSGSVEIE